MRPLSRVCRASSALFLFCVVGHLATARPVDAQFQQASRSLQQRLFELHRPESFELELGFNRARSAITELRWEEAVDQLQQIIDADTDGYLPYGFPTGLGTENSAADPIGERPNAEPDAEGAELVDPTRPAGENDPATGGRPQPMTWKSLAAATLSALPEAGQNAYRRRYEAATAASLSIANDLAKRRSLALRYRWTETGFQEALRLASLDLDTGRLRSAESTLSALLDVADDAARESVEERIRLAQDALGRQTARPVSDWLRPGGDSTGFAPVVETAVTTEPLWKRPLIREAVIGDAVEQYESNLSQALEDLDRARRGKASYRFAIEPIVVGSTVLTSGLGQVEAFDLATGELRWRSALPDQTLHYLARRLVGDTRRYANTRVLWLMQKLLADRSGGTLAAHRDRVYAIIDSGVPLLANDTSAESSPHPLAEHPFNRLVSFEVATGRVRWWVGGPGTGAVSVPLASVKFLGPPAFVEGSLFVIGELAGEIRLFEIDEQAGTEVASMTLWKPQIGQQARANAVRGGVTPLVSGTQLICPLDDAIVAIDIPTRRITWTRSRSLRFYTRQRPGTPSSTDEALWATASLQAGLAQYPDTVVAGGRVICMSPRGLRAINALDGTALWSQSRTDELWIEALTDQTCVFATVSGVRSVDLNTGETTWVRRLPPLSGSGIVRRNLLTLPLQSRSVATIDLRDGSILAVTGTARDTALGTLVAGSGQLVTLNGRECVAFNAWTPSVMPTLAASPSSEELARATIVGAELLHRGRAAQSLSILRQVFERTPDDLRVRTLLASAAIASREDDPKEAMAVARTIPVEGIPASTATSLRQLRLESFRASGDELSEALEYFDIIGLGKSRQFRTIEKDYVVNEQQLAVAQLARLADRLGADDRAELRRRVTARLEQATPAARRALADRIPKVLLSVESATLLALAAEPLLRREALLWSILDGDLGDNDVAEPQRTQIAAELCRIYSQAERPHDLAEAMNYLAPGSPTDDEIRSQRQVQSLTKRVPFWNTESIEVTRRERPANGDGFRPLRTMDKGRTSRSLRDWRVGPQGREFSLVSPEGDRVETFPAAAAIYYSFSRVQYAERLGHLGLVAAIDRAEIYDTLSHPPRPLGVLPLFPAGNPQALLSMRFRGIGLKGDLPFDSNGNAFGSIGPLTRRCLVYLKDERLTAVDPFEPAAPPLWEVTGLPAGSELFGDDRIILARLPGGTMLRGFDPLDGNEIAVGELPNSFLKMPQNRISPLVGRGVLCLADDDVQPMLFLYDALSGGRVWQQQMAADTRMQRFSDDVLLVSPSENSIAVIDTATGKSLARLEQELTDETEVGIVRDGETLYVVTADPVATPEPGTVGPSERLGRRLRNTDSIALNGRLTAVNVSTGDVRWSREILHQHLPVGQPQSWPFLLCAANSVKPKGPDSSRVMSSMSVMLISKRSGETLWEADDVPYELSLAWRTRPGSSPRTAVYSPSFELTIVESEAPADVPPEQPESEPSGSVPSEEKAPSE